MRSASSTYSFTIVNTPTQEGEHHKVEDFATRGKEPEDEVQMYTWMDATLRELTDLVKEVQTAARNPRARLQFALVYPDRQGQNVLKPVCMCYKLGCGCMP